MKRLLKSPTVNAVCISLFSAFYWFLFALQAGTADYEWLKYYDGSSPFWALWSNLILDGLLMNIAYVLIGVTILVVVLLIIRRRPYDEYHAAILTNCLIVAIILTLIAIAIFYWIVLSEPFWIAGKFTLFIVIHWTTVVFANLTYVLLCRWR
ncbi:MAG: hypothetical protein GXY50_11165 [Syntrophomonadaceae bacterium]|nr:hypothetical protein [Syntrophomonadaceae bacterium]